MIRMMQRSNSVILWRCAFLSLLVVSLASPLAAQENSALVSFNRFVQTVSAAKGEFSQYTVGPEGETALAQSGEFAFARPGKFRWDIRKPYSQLVVSDGKSIYQYDPDLSQVSVRTADAAIGSSPAAILFGTGDIKSAFDVSALPDEDGFSWFRAEPKQPDSGLSQVDIGMKEGNPARLLLLDGFGQTTRIDLAKIRAQSSFPASTFEFEAPPDTDIVRID